MKAINFQKLLIYVAIGGAIALIIISALILSVNNPNPAWGKNWFVRPILITPTLGAIGGFSFYMMYQYEIKNEIGKLARILFSVLVFIFFLWIGIILGLDETLWN